MVGRQAGLLFNNLYQFVPSKVEEDQYDLLLVDEAHRIQKSSNFQYTPKQHRTEMPQIEQLIRASRTSVFVAMPSRNLKDVSLKFFSASFTASSCTFILSLAERRFSLYHH